MNERERLLMRVAKAIDEANSPYISNLQSRIHVERAANLMHQLLSKLGLRYGTTQQTPLRSGS